MERLDARRRVVVRTLTVAAMVAGSVVGLAAPASAAIFAPSRHQVTTLPTAIATKSVTVSCPLGTVVYGAGGAINGGDGAVVLTGIVPSPLLTTVTATAAARGLFAGVWSLSVTAVCADPAYAPTRVSSAAAGQWSTVAECPLGTVLYGTGFALVTGGRDVYLTELVPDMAVGTVRVRAGGSALPPVAVAAFGICAWPMWNQVRLQGVSLFNSTSPKTVTTTSCPPGEGSDSWVFGVGGLVIGAPNVFIDLLEPNLTLTVGLARAVRVSSGLTGTLLTAVARTDTTNAGTTKAGTMNAGITGAGTGSGDGYGTTAYATCIGSWY